MSTINNWVMSLSTLGIFYHIFCIIMILLCYLLSMAILSKKTRIRQLEINYETAYAELKRLRVLIAIKELGSGELSIKDLPNFFHEISRNLPDEHNDLIVRIALITIDSFHDKETFLHEVSNLLSNVTQIGVKIRVKDS